MSIPRYPGDITREWLSSRPEQSRHTPCSCPTSTWPPSAPGRPERRIGCRSTYAGDAGSLPDTFVIKLPAQDDTVRDRVTIGYRSECAFYTGVADRVQVPDPAVFLLRDQR